MTNKGMTVSDLARFLAENHLLLHVIRMKPSKTFTATLEPIGASRTYFYGTNRSPGAAVDEAVKKFETWLQGRARG
jgi:hypothetical protein